MSVSTQKTGAPGWMKLLLVASLAVNLLVLGALLGATMSGHGPWRDGPRGGADMGALTRALSDEDRRALRGQMRQAFGPRQEARAAVRAEMDGLVTALRAEPFDAADVAARIARVRGLMGARLEAGQDILVRYWAGMSPDARNAYADRLDHALKRRHGP